VAQAQRLRWEIRAVGGAWQVVRPDGRLQRTFESQREAIAYLTGLRDGTMSVREALATAAVEVRGAMRAAELRVAAETSEIAAFQWVTGASA